MKNILEPKKIAILRANALGDFIFVLPALQALKERFPKAELILLGKQWHKDFLTGRPGPVDRVIVVPAYPGVGEPEEFEPDPQELDVFFKAMQQEKFDIAYQMHGGGGNSNPFLLRLGAKLNVGLQAPGASELDITIPYVYYFSETLRYLEVAAQTGAAAKHIEPVVMVTEKDIQEAGTVLQHKEKPIAAIHPGATDLRRRWPAADFAAIADFLAEKGYAVYVTGVSSEKDTVEAVIAEVQHKNEVTDLCSRLTINGMTGLLSMASLLVSNDTGPLHLARAVKTPTVGIYWCSNLITGMPMTTGAHRSLLSFIVNCPLCGMSNKKFDKEKNTVCDHKTSFVTDVSVDEVKEAVEELLALELKEIVKDASEAA